MLNGAGPFILVFVLLIVIQQPSLAVEIVLEKSFYQPGEPVSFNVIIGNMTQSKECLKSMDISVRDSYILLCAINQNYSLDTECIEAGEEKIYPLSCALPPNTAQGQATVEVVVETWNGSEILHTEYFEIGINYPPEIRLISYPEVVNPSQEYMLTFSVYDSFGVEDLASAQVKLYSKIGKPSEREYYTYDWEAPDPYTLWVSDFPVSAEISLQTNEVVWTLRFSLSEIASPGDWTLEIGVYDKEHQYGQAIGQLVVTKYVSFHLEGSFRAPATEINFGKAEPGEELPKVALTIVVTSNLPVNISVLGSDLYSPEGKVLPMDVFYVEVPGGLSAALDGSRQLMYVGHAEKQGFCRKTKTLLVFWGKLPEAVEAGTYSGIWYIIVEAV